MPDNDPTTNPELRSWIDAANAADADFPIQNLPFGVFRRAGGADLARVGVAIGDRVLDLAACDQEGLFGASAAGGRGVFAEDSLNTFLSLGRGAWTEVRARVSELLREDVSTLRDHSALRSEALIPLDHIELLLPVRIGDYTDFYASIHHATNVGSMFRPDNPLLPNYKHLPVGYHGRASSIVASGAPVRRPMGQTRPNDDEPPVFGPSKLLDYELEMGYVLGPGNQLGRRIDINTWREHIFGLALVNDWSARDIQKWEYQPLGPFNAKNFATTMGHWVVTVDALAPFRVDPAPRGDGDPAPLDYLTPAGDAWDVTLEVQLQSRQMRERGMDPIRVSRGSLRHMYWTAAQMLAHHTSTGCNMRPGDLFASGTVSGPDEESRGCLLERTWRGSQPLSLPTGEERKFLQDGDVVIMRGWCEADGARRIGLGECRGEILPAE